MICSTTREAGEGVPQYDFTLRRGDSARFGMRFLTLAEGGDRLPLDLSGSALVLTIRWPDGELICQSGGEDSAGMFIEPLQGTIICSLTPEQTSRIPQGRIAAYGLVRDVAGGERRTLLAGAVIGQGDDIAAC